MNRLITGAQADEWRYQLADGGRRYVIEPETGLFGPRGRITVYEENGTGGWEPVAGNTFSASVIEECGDYLRRLADYLKGLK